MPFGVIITAKICFMAMFLNKSITSELTSQLATYRLF